MESINNEDIFYIENSMIRLDKLVKSKYAFPQEKAASLKFLLEDILMNMDYLQVDTKITEETCKKKVTLNIRKEIREEIKNELKTKTSVNLCIEEDFLEFMDKYCDIDPNKSIQASRLMKIYNDLTKSDITVVRLGKIIKYVSEKRPVSLKLKRDGTYYVGFDVKKEYLDENDNVIVK